MWFPFHKFITWPQPKSARFQEPLLTDADVQQIQHTAISGTVSALSSTHEVLHPLLGERSSVFAGSGLEFADNRLYAAGDDMRFINWRLWARSGQLYRKLFIEERRPEVWIVMDRRDSMRFGTRRQPKVTQAARVALYYLYRALHQQLACGALLLDKQVHWIKPVRSLTYAQTIQQQFIAACPPDDRNLGQGTYSLTAVLQQLQTQLIAGSIVILISDFHDLTPNALSPLYALNQQHTVLAIHIADPLETVSPTHGHYTIQNHDSDIAQQIRADDATWRQQWQAILQQHQQLIETTLKNAHVPYHMLLTTTDISNSAGHFHDRPRTQ